MNASGILQAEDGLGPIDESRWLGGALRLRQPARGHRAGTDAILLAALARGLPGARVVDAGAGVGAAGLALAAREPERSLTLVELDPALAALATENVALNGLAARARVVVADVTAKAAVARAGLAPHSADLVMMNPPWLDPARHRLSPRPQRRGSHAMPAGDLTAWIGAARRLLAPGGRLALIHRAESLAEVLVALRGFGAVALRPVQPRTDAPAHRILVSARLNSRAPAVILPALVLHDAVGFTPEAEAIHRDLAALASV